MYRTVFIMLVLFTFAARKSSQVQGCHAGHTQSTDDGDDDDDYDSYEYEYEDYHDNLNHTTAPSRKKRQVEQFGEEYVILRRYFRECLFDRVPEIWDWKSVVDFTILKTLWFFYSGTIECVEASRKDTAECWKECVDVYLRNTSNLLKPTKECVEQYEIDFRNNISVYRRTSRAFDPPTSAPRDTYSECVQVQYNEADPNSLVQDTGFSTVTAESPLDIPNVVDFVKTHVLCVICDFSPLPFSQNRPNPKNNVLIGQNKLTDGAIVYTTTWPFGLEALIRKDARLRYSINFCNTEFEGTFREDPPPSLGWTQWYTWGVCNAACGVLGTQRRQRVCLDDNRRNCTGSTMESRACVNRDCAYWSQWGAYTPCLSTCDLSEQYSFRFCVNGNFGDVGCQGQRRRRRSCAVSSCPVPWSSWSGCSASCGIGTQYRTGGPSMMKVRTESRSCTIRDCPQIWSRWSPWAPCSVTCGFNGVRKRVRTCESRVPCIGPTQQTSVCEPGLQPCKNTWGSWTPWSGCNYQMRTRVCWGGNDCVGMMDEYKTCAVNRNFQTYTSRPVVHQWSWWSQWSTCDKTCGYGKRVRSRLCGGSKAIPTQSCAGNHLQSVQCKIKPCDSSGSSCQNHYVVDKTCYKNRINCLGEIGRRFCKKACGFC